MLSHDKYFLQMSECKWPDHIFISTKKTFKICIYHKDPQKQHPSLYCVTSDEEAYPVSIELLNSKNKVIRESNASNNRYKKLWTIINASTDFKIKHSYCEFSIRFDSLPPYYDQPLRFRFNSSSSAKNQSRIPLIAPFTTRPFRVVRYQLRISSGPPLTFYKDDGGMRNNHMTVRVELYNPSTMRNNHKMSVPLLCKLMTEDGKEIRGTMKKKKEGKVSKYNNKSRPPLHYLQLHEDCLSPKISSLSGECIVKFRINDVSQNHKNQGFHVIIQPNTDKLPHLCEVYECVSNKIIVKSKSPEKLSSQNTSKKRSHYVHNANHGSHKNGNKKHKKAKKSKSKRKRKNSIINDSDGDYNPQQSDYYSDYCESNNNNNKNLSAQIKVEMEGCNGHSHNKDRTIENNLRKRRKLNGNGTQYMKTNGSQYSMKPKTFNSAPNQHWFPLPNATQTKKKQNQPTMVGTKNELKVFAQNCFEMLQFREWVCIGYQTQFLNKDNHESNDKLQIVRCLLCDAEGVWYSNKIPRHKKGCDFVKLKRSYQQMSHASSHNLYSSIATPNIISPKISHLPPLPQSLRHNGFIPPAFPPPFFAPIPPMFPPRPSYHIIQAPHALKKSKNESLKSHGNDASDKQETKIKIKTQKDKTDKNSNSANHSNNNKSSPLIFPFGHGSPQIFPANVGPISSPLFSMSNVPQTPQMFTTQPLSANGPPNNQFSLSNSGEYHHHHHHLHHHHTHHLLPSFGHTASQLPMPLNLAHTNIIHSKDQSREDKGGQSREAKTGKSDISSTIGTMGSPTNTLASNPPQSTTPNNSAKMSLKAIKQSKDNDSGIISQSASISAVATAGGLTVNTPLPCTPQNQNENENEKNGTESKMILAHAPPLLNNILPRYNGLLSNILHASPNEAQQPLHSQQHSSNNSIETQIGSMPPLHPDTNTCSSNKSSSPTTDDNSKPLPLHERRLMENAPTTLSIPTIASNTTPFPNMT